MLVKVHALLWVGDRVVVHEEHRQGELVLTLPGGRVLDREHLEVALRREVEEEIVTRILVGRLHYVAEVVHGHRMHELSLVFGAEALTPVRADTRLVAPAAADGTVLPPIFDRVCADGPAGPPSPLWLGNVWRSLE